MGALDGQVAIVTGGGSGIGRETARMLAAEGAQVVVSGRRQGVLDEAVTEIMRAGGKAVARRADMENETDPAALAEWTIKTFGRVDILINNAGHSSTIRAILWLRKQDWDSVLAANLTGVYLITQAVLPSMIERGGGTIVTVSSVAGIRPGLMGGVPYSAAKAAVRNLMGHIHSEHRDKGIRATTILPAEVDTPILDRRPLPPNEKARSTMMQPEDVARAIMLCVLLPPRTVIEEIVMVPHHAARHERGHPRGQRDGRPAVLGGMHKGGTTMGFSHVLVPTDLSDPANHALRCAIEEATLHRAKVTVLHVLPEHSATEVYYVARPAGGLAASHRSIRRRSAPGLCAVRAPGRAPRSRRGGADAAARSDPRSVQGSMGSGGGHRQSRRRDRACREGARAPISS